MRLPDLLTEMFDPAGRYLRLTTPRARRRRGRNIPRRTAAYTSVDAKRPEMLDDAQRRRLEYEAIIRRRSVGHEARDVYVGLAASAAIELRAHGHATIDTPSGTLNVDIVRFWRGDAVLEIRQSERPESWRRVRIDRTHLGDVQRLAAQLATQVWSILEQ